MRSPDARPSKRIWPSAKISESGLSTAPRVLSILASMTAVAVDSERIRTLYRQSVPVLLANILIGVIVSATIWSSAPRPLVVTWIALLIAMTAARIVLRRRYWKAQPTPAQAGRWGTMFVVGSATAGVLWG